MATSYNYALILVVNAANAKALEAVLLRDPIGVLQVTIDQVRVDPQQPKTSTSINSMVFSESTDSSTRLEQSSLKFVTLQFKPDSTLATIKADLKAGTLDGLIKNCQHYSLFKITSPSSDPSSPTSPSRRVRKA